LFDEHDTVTNLKNSCEPEAEDGQRLDVKLCVDALDHNVIRYDSRAWSR
jgi:hypothetical protein